MKILWLSRHIPQEKQVEALKEKFGNDIKIVQKSISLNNNPYLGANEVEELLQEIGAIEMVGVLPIAHVAQLTKRNIKPIRAIMTRTPTGKMLDNGEIEYEFVFEKFERILKVEIVSEDL